MDIINKYGVLTVLVIWYLVITITSALFIGASDDFFSPRSPEDMEENRGIDTLKVLTGVLYGTPIPAIPGWFRFFLSFPFYMLAIYFIYLNLPKNPILSSPDP